MKKLIRYITIFLISSWVTTVSASLVAIESGGSGVYSISGIQGTSAANAATIADTLTFTFAFFINTPITVNQAIANGGLYNVATSFSIFGGQTFSSNFNILSQSSVPVPAGGSEPLVQYFRSIIGSAYPNTFTMNGAPNLSTFLLDGATLNLTQAVFSTINPLATGINNAQLTLTATEISNYGALNTALYNASANGSIPNTSFNQGNITIQNVPEPTTMALLAAGFLSFGAFRRKATQA